MICSYLAHWHLFSANSLHAMASHSLHAGDPNRIPSNEQTLEISVAASAAQPGTDGQTGDIPTEASAAQPGCRHLS